MVEHLVTKGVNTKIEYLSEQKFIKETKNLLATVFNYNTQLTADQFVKGGFSERKLILALDVYDLVKQIKKQTKIHKKLHANVDAKWEHPCDLAIKDYAVCDHQENIRRDMQFRINSTLMESKLELKAVIKLEEKEPAPGQ